MLQKEDYALILSKSCEYFEIELNDLIGKSRKRFIVEARRFICFEIRTGFASETLERIGSFLGKRDHSTVMHNLDCHDDLMRYDNGYATKYKEYSIYFNTKIAPLISTDSKAPNKYVSLIEKKERLIMLMQEVLEIERSIYLEK